MTPGQTVNKDVSAVNTGNVAAFVRAGFENVLDITEYGSLATNLTITARSEAKIDAWQIKVTPTTGDAYYLSTKYDSEDDASTAKNEVDTSTLPEGATLSVEQTVQAADAVTELGGATSFTWPTKPVELTTNEVRNADTYELTPNEVTTLQAGGRLVLAASKPVLAKDQTVVAGDDDTTTGSAITDYDGAGQFSPADNYNGAEGLYIFKRTIYAGDADDETKYSGYYYKGGKYYALATESTTENGNTKTTAYIDFGSGKTGFGLDADGQIISIDGDVSLLTTTTTEDADLTYALGNLTETGGTESFTAWTNGTASSDNVNAIQVTYDVSGSAPDVVFYVKLASNWSTNWTYIAPDDEEAGDKVIDWFYYNKVLESGATTPKLIESVKLSNKVTNRSFAELTYDLTAKLESAQVTYNEEGDQTDEALTEWKSATNGNVTDTLYYSVSGTDTEYPATPLNDGKIETISKVTWAEVE